MTSAGCSSSGFFTRTERVKPSTVYSIDETTKLIQNETALDKELQTFEFRFADAPLSQVVDALNEASDEYTIYICGNPSQGVKQAEPKGKDEVVPASRLSDELVTGLFSGSMPSIVRDIAQVLNVKVHSIGGKKFYLGEIQEDLNVDYIVRTDLSEVSFKELTAVYEKLKAVRVGSRVYVRGPFFEVQDFVSALERFDDQSKSYLVNLVFIRSSRSKINDIKARVEFESIDLLSSGYSLLDVFSAHGAIDLNGTNSRYYSEQELLTTDGVKSQLTIGNDREQEQRSISDQGTSTVSGYRTINDGITVEITPKSSIGNFVNLALTFSNSKFDGATGFNRYKTDVEYESLKVELNKIYYVASLEENSNSRSYEFLGLRGSATDEVVTVWLSMTAVNSSMTRTNF